MKNIFTKFVMGIILLLVLSVTQAQQTSPPIKITTAYIQTDSGEVLIKLIATVQKGGKLFTIEKKTLESLSSTIQWDTVAQQFMLGSWLEAGNAVIEKDPALENAEVKYYTDSVVWTQKARLPNSNKKTLEGKVEYLVKVGDEYQSGEQEFAVTIPDAVIAQSTNKSETAKGEDGSKSMWSYFLGGLLAGFGAFIMPCIYAMVPVTVSFFTKRSKTRKQGIKNALVYSASIIGVFTAIGFLITLLFGPAALNNMASSAWFNIFVFIMFVVFGISFLGAFEITLPSSWTNKVDTKAGLGSYSGIFFMALTLVIVSFSCTVPFIGLLTVWTAKGGMLAPLVGFLGFSFALSLPFALFAFFPALLNNMAKSGGWLNTIKVALGFIELALALKFLSSADLAYHWRLLDREVYLSLWIVIFGLLGLYLLGKLKFHHDDDLPKNDYGHPYLTVTRLFFAIATLTFTVYMIPGLWGAPLKAISAWLPEMKTQDFNLNKTAVYQQPTQNSNEVKPKKYTDILESEVPGVEAFFDFEEGLAAAKQLNKPVMIDFTGHSCANCRKMEQEVLSDAEVMKRLQKDFVVISLYVDDKLRLPENEWYNSKSEGKQIKTMGEKNLDLEIDLTGNPAQPQYVFVGLDGKIIKNADGYSPDKKRFMQILDEVKTAFDKK